MRALVVLAWVAGSWAVAQLVFAGLLFAAGAPAVAAVNVLLAVICVCVAAGAAMIRQAVTA